MRRHPRHPAPALIGAIVALAGAPAALAQGQPSNPVYVDDAPGAAEAVARARDLAGAGNVVEAARVLQRLLDDDAGRMAPRPGDPDLFRSVRAAVHETLLSEPELLDAYRAQEREAAERLLTSGRAEAAERTRLLTTPGFDAALIVAQKRLENAQFDAALRVLRQLDRHPDRTGAAGRDAAGLASLLARYLDGPEAADLAARWRADAGLDPADTEAIDPPPMPVAVTPLSGVGPLDLRSLVPSPLHSQQLTIAANIAESDEADQTLRGQRARVQSVAANQQFVLPTLAGDTIYVNDGRTISAWDRFSLARIWTHEVGDIDTDRLVRIASRRPIEDACTVSVAGDWVVAATGVAVDGAREGDPRIHALDAATGEVRWRVDPALLDPSLEESSVRGTLAIDQGVVIVTVAKHVRQRRLLSIHMLGLDLESGSLLWSRPLGSAGALPYGSSALPGEAATIDGGVVYRADRLGFIAAVESVTGRPVWIRRMNPSPPQRAPEPPWHITAPVLAGGVLYSLTPDRAGVVALDAATGEMLGARDADELGAPLYLLRAGERLLFVGNSTLFTLPIEGFADADPRRIVGPLTRVLVGRVVVAGDRALAPVEGGILVAPLDIDRNTDTDAPEPETLALDYPGNLLATESQIVAIDDQAVHSYLLWDVAERILRERMESSPDDPAPAATFAELAYRDGREDRIVPAIDAALGAIERAPMRPEIQRVREQLFDAVLDMVQPPTGDAPRFVLERPTRVQLFERLDRLAATPGQRVERLVAAGVFFERGGDIPRAVDAYQRILAEPDLAGVRLELGQTSRPADDEAAARLRRIVREHGPAVYAPFEAEAERALAGARRQDGVNALEAVARRYPVARAAAEAWVEASRRHEQAARPRAAIAALEEAMRIADDAGIGDDTLVGRVGGALVRLLMAHNRVAAASALLDRLASERPGLILSDGRETLDVPSLRRELAALGARLERRPVIGPLQTELPAQVIRGLAVATPVLDPVSGGPTSVILLRGGEEWALWEIDPATGLRQRWSVPRENDDTPVLLDERGLLLSRRDAAGRTLLLYAPSDGRILWQSTVLPPPDGADDDADLIDTPLGLRRSMREALVSVEDGLIALVERSGRIAVLDQATGRAVWTADSVDRVYDAATADGVLVVAGAMDKPAPADAPAAAGARTISELETPSLMAFDLRNGRLLQDLSPEGGQIRWVRMTPEGEALVGLDRGVASFEMAEGRRRWFTGGLAGAETVDAWAFPGRVIVMDNAGDLRQIETENGRARGDALASRGRFSGYGNGLRPVWPAALDDKAAFATQNGLVLFDRRGDLAGADHRNAARLLAPVGYAQERVVVIDQQVAEQDAQGVWFRVLVFGSGSLRLEAEHAIRLGAQPERLDLLDGRVLVTAGEAVLVIDAPPAPAGVEAPAPPDAGPDEPERGEVPGP
jgi:outer membrane protein assembly factor BamB/tetratricopeptide (TPR) repeat protein